MTAPASPDLTPALLFEQLRRRDPAAPRITCYDDVAGPTQGERIELSARVLGTWAAKGANALQEEYDLEPGGHLGLALAPHWRALYWALAAWQVGGAVALDGSDGGIALVTDDPAAAAAHRPSVLVTRAALARAATTPVAGGVMDEAAELATYGDVFEAWAEPGADDPALITAAGTWGHGELVPAARELMGDLPAGARLQLVDPDVETLLLGALASWTVDGSIVVHLGRPDPDQLARRERSEGVDLTR